MLPRLVALMTASALATTFSVAQENDKEKTKQDEEASAIAKKFAESFAKKFDVDDLMKLAAVPFVNFDSNQTLQINADTHKAQVLRQNDKVSAKLAAAMVLWKKNPLKEPLRIMMVESYEDVRRGMDDSENRRAYDAVLKKTDRIVWVGSLQNDWGTSRVDLHILVAWRDGRPKVVGYEFGVGGRGIAPNEEATEVAKKFAKSFIMKFDPNDAMKVVEVPFLSLEKKEVRVLKEKDQVKATLKEALELAKKMSYKEPLTVTEVVNYTRFTEVWLPRESVKKFDEAVKYKDVDRVVIMNSVLDDGTTMVMFTFVTWRHGQAVVFGYYLESRRAEKK